MIRFYFCTVLLVSIVYVGVSHTLFLYFLLFLLIKDHHDDNPNHSQQKSPTNSVNDKIKELEDETEDSLFVFLTLLLMKSQILKKKKEERIRI